MLRWLALLGCGDDGDDGTAPTGDSGAETGPIVLDLADAGGTWTGVGADDWAGRHVAVAGDLDDDGAADLLVSALWNDQAAEDAGAVYVVSGPATGSGSLATASAVLLGESANDAAGVSAAGAGDVDGDGFDDVIVGGDGHDSPFANAGAVYVVRGPLSGIVPLANAHAIAYGEDNGDLAGVSTAGAGDTDGDGFDDVIVGARYHDLAAADAGAVYLLRGPLSGPQSLGTADAKVLGELAGDWLGLTVASAGDVDGDGLADVAAGAVYTAEGGTVYVLRGPLTGLVSAATAHAKVIGEAADDRAGRIGGGGDVDGDGRIDLLVGAPGNDAAAIDAGAAYLVPGTELEGTVALAGATATFTGESAGSEGGSKIAHAGDVDGDGHGDVLVAAWLDDGSIADAGASYLLFGPISGTGSLASADRIWRGQAAGDQLGSGLAAGDLDADGRPDLVFGALKQDEGATDAGAVYVFPGTSL